MGQAYVITSGKNGVGKTLTVFNIGVALSMLGKKVIMIDADTCLPSLDKVAGLEEEVKAVREIMDMNGLVYNIEYLLKHTDLLEYIIIKHKEYRNLSFIPAVIIGGVIEKRCRLMEDLVLCLKERFDYVLIDSPSVKGEDFMNAASAADRAVIVTAPDKTSSEDLYTVMTKLEDYGFVDHMHIINGADEDMEKAYSRIARRMAGGYLGLLNERSHAGIFGGKCMNGMRKAGAIMYV